MDLATLIFATAIIVSFVLAARFLRKPGACEGCGGGGCLGADCPRRRERAAKLKAYATAKIAAQGETETKQP